MKVKKKKAKSQDRELIAKFQREKTITERLHREISRAASKRELLLFSTAQHQRANRSEKRARSRYGDKAVDAAIVAAIKANLNKRFFEHERPYAELMKWYRAQGR